jgi:CHAT domain-containing protein/Tfp pilus assembly protein PilF
MFSLIKTIVSFSPLIALPVSNLFYSPQSALLLRSLEGKSLITHEPKELAQTVSNELDTNASESSIEDEIFRLLTVASEQSLAEDYTALENTYQQALLLIERLETPDLLIKGEVLRGLGLVYSVLRRDNDALPILEEALALYTNLVKEQIAGSADQSETTSVAYTKIQIELYRLLGAIHADRANYATALGYNQAGLVLAEALDHKWEQANFHHNIGSIEVDLGQYEKAKASFSQAIGLNRQSISMNEQAKDERLEVSAIATLGWISDLQRKYAEAIAHYQEAITLYETLSNTELNNSLDYSQDIVSRQARTLNNLGMVHLKQGNQTLAQATFERGLTLLALKDGMSEPPSWLIERAILINSLGELYQAKGDRDRAWQSYLQAFQLAKQTQDKIGEIEALLNFGRLMEAQGQPNLAIFFYKQAIAQIETIRENLQPLSQSVQQRYTQTVEDFYRNLADLLLQQNRGAEALQVLELLKLQEVQSYLRSNSAQGREETLNTSAEAALLEAFYALPMDTSLTDFLASAEAIAVSDSQRDEQSDRTHHPANDPSESPDSDDDLNNLLSSSQAIASLQSAIKTLPVETAVLYPLILENRLEILLLTSDGSVQRFTQAQVSRAALSNTVEDFQNSLKDKTSDVKPAAQQLYDWLIQPLEETLAAHQVKNIIYLPDGVLRYVPLAAFHDGEQWLVQKYQSHNITAATIDDLVTQSPAPLSVVAGAFTDSSQSYPVPVGSDTEYRGLSAARQEINNLAEAIPDTLTLLNQDFTSARMLASVGDRRIVHLATHAKFLPGQPEDSFILFGDGSTVDMRQLQTWALPNVDLVVLSACETARSVEGDGKEILGLGYQIQKTGAGAAIASLWSADDHATAALMNQFYLALKTGTSKAEALKQAQIELIESENFSHPYYWSAFILIGNGR